MIFNAHLSEIKSYEPGKPIELIIREYGIKQNDIIKLASNENPQGTSKLVQRAIKQNAKFANLYPDDSMFELKEALSKKYNVTSNNIIIGSGSDQVIEFLIHAKANQNSAILTAKTTFSMYEIYAKHVGAKVYKTPSDTHNLDEFLEVFKKHQNEISIIFLCVPNNPLGECLDADEIYKFIEKIDKNTLIVIDGAYNEFAKFKDIKKFIDPKKISGYENVIYLGTFSKLYGLGGMRVGYGVANENIISSLSKLRAPFNITTLSLKAATTVLEDESYIKKTLKNNFKEMKRYEKFAKKHNIKFIPSYTNFITFFVKNSSEICDSLLKKGIILRNLKSYESDAIRITIGLRAQNKRVLKELEGLL